MRDAEFSPCLPKSDRSMQRGTSRSTNRMDQVTTVAAPLVSWRRICPSILSDNGSHWITNAARARAIN